ncbi:MAG: hypothetical protein ACTSPR_01350 [Candidatus Thorarchaeota archaeon]
MPTKHRVPLLLVGIICVSLAILGIFMQPFEDATLIEILGYEVTVIGCIVLLLFLMYKGGFSE